jgi:hypothetical protein
MPNAGMKRAERDIFSPTTGKKYVNSPEHTKQRTEGERRRTSNKSNMNRFGNLTELALPKNSNSEWSADEDEKLIRGAVTTDCNWKKVQAVLSHRTMDQCQWRWQQIGAKRIGEHWTNAEDKALTDIVNNNAQGSWSVIADKLFERTGSLRLVRQCRDRWSLVLEPEVKKKEKAEKEKADATEDSPSRPSEEDESESSEDDDDEISPKHIQLTSPRWEDLPSIGSAGHNHGLCKRCCFFPKGRCMNGYSCNFCHFSHEKRIRKNKHKNRRERERARKSERAYNNEEQWGTGEWSEEWGQSNEYHQCFHPEFPQEYPMAFNVQTPNGGPMFAPTQLPMMPPVFGNAPQMDNCSELKFAPNGVDSTPFMPGQSVVFPCSRQTSFQTACSGEMMHFAADPCFQQAPVLVVGESSEDSTEPTFSEDVNPEEATSVRVWLEGMSAEYQFTPEDLKGFFGAYGNVTDVTLHKGGGGIVKFETSGVACRAAKDLDRIGLPALGGVLCVKVA